MAPRQRGRKHPLMSTRSLHILINQIPLRAIPARFPYEQLYPLGTIGNAWVWKKKPRCWIPARSLRFLVFTRKLFISGSDPEGSKESRFPTVPGEYHNRHLTPFFQITVISDPDSRKTPKEVYQIKKRLHQPWNRAPSSPITRNIPIPHRSPGWNSISGTSWVSRHRKNKSPQTVSPSKTPPGYA